MATSTGHKVLAALLLVSFLQSAIAGYQPAVIRLDAGSASNTFTDADGNVWGSDSHYKGGAGEVIANQIQNADDNTEQIYTSYRIGQAFQYTFGQEDGLVPGQTYTIALHFAELYFSDIEQRIFNVQINGVTVLQDFDIVAAAGGKNMAVVQTFPVTVGSDGVLSIMLVAVKDQATLAALEITIPALLRINAGATENFTDTLGQKWLADFAYIGDGNEHVITAIAGTEDGTGPIYQDSHAAAEFSYIFYKADGLQPYQSYAVVLHFAELRATAPGQRTFNVQANGEKALTNYDVYSRAGSARFTAITAHFDVTLDSSATLFLAFEGIDGSEAEVAAIEIYPAPPVSQIVEKQSIADVSTPSADAPLAAAPAASPGSSPEAAAEPAAAPVASPADSLAAPPADSLPQDKQEVVMSTDTTPSAAPETSTAATPSQDIEIMSMSTFDDLAPAPAPEADDTAAAKDELAAYVITRGASPGASPSVAPEEATTETGVPDASPVAAPEQATMELAAAPDAAPVAAPQEFTVDFTAATEVSHIAAPEEATTEFSATIVASSPIAAPEQAIWELFGDVPAPAALPPMPDVPQRLSADVADPGLVYAPSGDQLGCQDVMMDMMGAAQYIVGQLGDNFMAKMEALRGTPLDVYRTVDMGGNDDSIPLFMMDPCALYRQQLDAVQPLVQFLQGGGTLPDPLAPAPAPEQATAEDEPSATVQADFAAPAASPDVALEEATMESISADVATPSALPPMPWFQPGVPAAAPQPEFTLGFLDPELPCEDLARDLENGINYIITKMGDNIDAKLVALQGTPLDPTYGGADSLSFLMEDPCTQYSQIYKALLPLLHFLQNGGILPEPFAPAPAPEAAPEPALGQPGLPAPSAAPDLAPIPALSTAPAPAPLMAPITAPAAEPALPPVPAAAPEAAGPNCPVFSGPKFTSQTVVPFQLAFPQPFAAPECAPGCLFRLSGGDASFDPAAQGYMAGMAKSFYPSADGTTFYGTLYFPLSANYPMQGQQPPIISTSMDFLGTGCGTDDISHLADITFDATTLTVTMTKVSERFGSPVGSITPAAKRMLLANETTLYALMLFNFSKPVTTFTADELIVRGGTVVEIIPVPDTNDYFVWVAVTPGLGAFSVSIAPGNIKDAAGNILFTDPTKQEVFAVTSDNGQFSPAPTPSVPEARQTPNSATVASSRAGLSRDAIIGLAIGLALGVPLAFAIVTASIWCLRRRRGSNKDGYADAVAADMRGGAKGGLPKTVTFKGNAAK